MKRWFRNLLMAAFAIMFAVSAFFLGRYWLQSRQSQQQFDDLIQIMEQAKPTAPQAPQQQETPQEGTAATEQATEPVSELVSVVNPKTGWTVEVLPEYAQLYTMNSDLAGWICIPDTNINYPVMQSQSRKDYYLYRDFYGRDSAHGSIYVREQCDLLLPSDNIVIYGHRMKDGSMFHNLLHYEKKDYYEAHKYIQFNTLRQRHTYEVIAVFKTPATASGFRYYQFIEAADEADFDAYVTRCKQLSLYDTGISAEYGDKLITLSTCEYSQDNGRMVIVAKQIT